MKGLGYLLLSAGFVVAAYATALDVEHVSWALFGAAVLAAVSGVVALKRYARSIAQSEEVLENNRAELRESIDNVVKDLREIVSNGSLRGAALRERIDECLGNDAHKAGQNHQVDFVITQSIDNRVVEIFTL